MGLRLKTERGIPFKTEDCKTASKVLTNFILNDVYANIDWGARPKVCKRCDGKSLDRSSLRSIDDEECGFDLLGFSKAQHLYLHCRVCEKNWHLFFFCGYTIGIGWKEGWGISGWEDEI